jgi:hypothetical protein
MLSGRGVYVLSPLHLPPSPRGHILLTSRAQVFDTIGIVKPVELNEMSPAEAQTFLLKRTGREYEGGPEPNAASELAAELGFLPLGRSDRPDRCAFLRELRTSGAAF